MSNTVVHRHRYFHDNETRFIVKEDNLLAELEEDFLKDKNGPGAAQDGEGLTGKNRVGYSSHGSPEQGLDSTLRTRGTKKCFGSTALSCFPSQLHT